MLPKEKMGFNYKRNKQQTYFILILFAIILVVLGSVLANAQSESKIEANKSWFSSFIGFFKSFFNKIFNSEITEPEVLVNTSEQNQSNRGKINENKNITVEITSNITCDYCQYVSNNTCLNYSCCNDSECHANETCSEYECIPLNCTSCQYAENHKCVNYECCKDEDCRENKICKGYICSVPSNETSYKLIPFETLQLESDSYEAIYTGPFMIKEVEIGFSLITDKDSWSNVYKNISGITPPEFSDFVNYFLIFAYMGKTCARVYPEIENITQKGSTIYITSKRMGQCKDIEDEGWHIAKVKRSDLAQRENLTFVFIAEIYGGSGYIRIGSVNINQI